MRLKIRFLSEPNATTISSYYLSSMETKDSISRDKEIVLTNSTPQQELTTFILLIFILVCGKVVSHT